MITLAELQRVRTNSSLLNEDEHTSDRLAISIVIPTYRREQILLETIAYLLKLDPAPAEILIVDQTQEHEKETELTLKKMEEIGAIRWLRLEVPSVTHAMNVGLQQAFHLVVLFLDDDIIPSTNLIFAHANAQAQSGVNIVAGQVLQPGEEPLRAGQETGEFRFHSSQTQHISEIMGGNFSIKRELALRLGGFDENFVHVAYRFEAEFANRALQAGEKILFVPEASIHHLKSPAGGTRSYGEHLKTIKPSHAVGAYYYLLRAEGLSNVALQILERFFRSIRTKHHLKHPWWIPPTLIAEAIGFIWAVYLWLKGPKLLPVTLTKPEQ